MTVDSSREHQEKTPIKTEAVVVALNTSICHYPMTAPQAVPSSVRNGIWVLLVEAV